MWGVFMMLNSLIWLQDSIKQKIDARVITDLGLHTIYESLIEMSEHSESVIYQLCIDQKTINYRQDILKDLVNSPQLLSDLSASVEGFLQFDSPLNIGNEATHNFYGLINLVIIVEATGECLEALAKALSVHEVHSEGLTKLKEDVATRISSKAFLEMKRDLNEIRELFNRIKSVEVSINMFGITMTPVEAQVTEINEAYYKAPMAFRAVSTTLEVEQSFLGIQLKNYVPLFNLGSINWDLLEELARAFKPHRAILNRFLKTYQRMDVSPYIELLKELTFYSASLKMYHQFKKMGLPLSMPKLHPEGDRNMSLKGFFNVNMAYSDKPIVLNDLEMNAEARIYILTGANQGGKTTLTQAIGQIQVFAQLGLFVPAAEASLSLVDNIFTHFPVKEKETIEVGRLGKECEMFSSMFHQATEKSLLLLNESFSGTSHLESLKIAEEAVMATKYRRVRMIFNTHLHELAMKTCHYNKVFWNDTNIESLVTGNQQESLSYKIHIGEPLGKSYARDVAEKYGVTYEQLTGKVG